MAVVNVDAPDDAKPRAARVPWLTVLVLAAVMAYGDGFVLTSTQGAVGEIGSNDSPFAFWLRHSTLVLPVFVYAVYRMLLLGRRRFGSQLRRPRAVVATALLVVALGSVVGTAEAAADAVINYDHEAAQLRATQSVHGHATPVTDAEDAGSCTGLCASLDATAAVQVRAAEYASVLMLAANVVLVGWVVAARGGRLDAVQLRRAGAGPPAGT
jgi:hypothetical protein